MLFDIRGRRKRVIQVVYATLALLMGASLFLVVGPLNVGELIGGTSAEDASAVLDEQAERTEEKLRQKPNDERLQLAVVRTRIGAGNAAAETDPQTGRPVITPEAKQDFDIATATWERYVKNTDEANPSVAQLVAGTYFNAAEGSRSMEEINANLRAAAAAQRLAAAARPSVGALSTLAIYEFFAGNFAAAERAGAEARRKAPKSQRKQLDQQMVEYRQRGKQWAAEKKRVAKVEREAGKESLQSPFGGLGGASGSLAE